MHVTKLPLTSSGNPIENEGFGTTIEQTSATTLGDITTECGDKMIATDTLEGDASITRNTNIYFVPDRNEVGVL